MGIFRKSSTDTSPPGKKTRGLAARAKGRSRVNDQRRREFEREALPHLDVLYGAALRYTRAPSEAEDLVQDTLLKAFRFYDRFEAGTNMRAWLLRIQTNTFINRYRRRTRERNVFDGALAKPVGEASMSGATMRKLRNPADEAERRMLANEIQAALDRLPEDYRVIIELADIQELAYREIAEILGCPIGTVMSRLHRARKTLRTDLVDQAVALGIVTAKDAKAPEGADTPVSLAEFRARRGRSVARAAGGSEA